VNRDKLIPLTPARDTGRFVVWRLVKPRAGESCRWETLDGRWITLSLGQGDDIGSVVIADSDGQRRLVESYEGALELAKEWRH
jgi:hypothetical protein